jgi:hypothetical protein
MHIYNIARHKHVMEAEVFSTSPLNISWRQDLIGSKLVAWNKLLPRIANIRLRHKQDLFH